MKKRCFSILAKLMAVVLIFTAVPVYDGVALADDFKYGDINADNEVNAQDALMALKFAAKMVEFSETAFVKGDVDDSNNVDAKDALLILKYAAKMIDKFPVEEEKDEPTDVPSGDPTVGPTLVPTVDATEVPSEAPEYESFPIGVVYEGDIATVEGDTITFKHPSISQDGVMLENPFAGKDTSNGLAISFWMRTTESVVGDNYTFRALITALRDTYKQAVKFDLEGTRQLATVDGDKLNYWEAKDASINAGNEYFITLVVNPEGLDYYVDGYSVGYSGYSGQGESTAEATAMALFAMEGTVLYAGGTTAADFGLQSTSRIYDHKLPEGTIISGLTGYLGNFTASDVEDLYLSVMEGHEPIPTTAPTTTPTATPEPTDTPAPTEDLTPTPPAEVTPDPTEDVLAFSGTLYIAGDSIADGVPESAGSSYVPQAGWGDYLNANYDSEKVYVNNQAKRGESCLSFFYPWDKKNPDVPYGKPYKNIYENIKKDDYLIISFGHNDQNTREDRYASPTAPSSERGSFKWWLKEKYIDPALAVGAVPILMTPVVRCTYDSNGKFTETAVHLSYGQAMRDLVAEYAAAGTTIYLIDAQQYTYDFYSGLTFEEAKTYHAYWKINELDDTHYNEKGANMLADYVTSELEKLPLAINQYVK